LRLHVGTPFAIQTTTLLTRRDPVDPVARIQPFVWLVRGSSGNEKPQTARSSGLRYTVFSSNVVPRPGMRNSLSRDVDHPWEPRPATVLGTGKLVAAQGAKLH